MCLQQDSKATTAHNNKGRHNLLLEQRNNKGQHSPLREQRSNNKEQRSLLREQRSNKGQHARRAIWFARQSRCQYLL